MGWGKGTSRKEKGGIGEEREKGEKGGNEGECNVAE